MSDLIQEHMTKPKSDDMSMDEILASIRKIISSSLEPEKNFDKIPEPRATTPSAHTVSQKNKTRPQEHSLSAREQLLALTKPNLYDTNDTVSQTHLDTKNRQNLHNHADDETQKSFGKVYEKPFYEKLAAVPEDNQVDEEKSDTNHDDEILQALNEIRKTLHHSVPVHIKENLEKEIFDVANKADALDRERERERERDANIVPVIDKNVTKSKEAIFDEISTKTSQFTGDAVPEFLKKFKQQQEIEKEKIQKKPTHLQYDFSKISNFDEVDEIITLTDKIMPMTQVDLAQKEEQEFDTYDTKKTSKKNFARLREGTEAIMKRAAERNMNDDSDDMSTAEHDDDTPMTNVIMRTLKPMLQEWIDENMQNIAEQVLRQEFRRGLK